MDITLDCAKFRVIRKNCSPEMYESIRNGTADWCRCKLHEAYKEVVRQFKEQHNQRLPWQDEEKQKGEEDQ